MSGAVRPGRECGGCNVCCVALAIREPTLQKHQGVVCPNNGSDGRCTIYPTRPPTCRSFLCGYLQLRWIRPTMRPDLSGVLVRPSVLDVDGIPRQRVTFTLLRPGATEADGLPEAVATAVAQGLVVELEVVGPPGLTYGRARVDEALALPVATRDRAAVLDLLRRCWDEGRTGGQPIPGHPAIAAGHAGGLP